jgi:hypothetical protein
MLVLLRANVRLASSMNMEMQGGRPVRSERACCFQSVEMKRDSRHHVVKKAIMRPRKAARGDECFVFIHPAGMSTTRLLMENRLIPTGCVYDFPTSWLFQACDDEKSTRDQVIE